jgi:hypothetical protein
MGSALSLTEHILEWEGSCFAQIPRLMSLSSVSVVDQVMITRPRIGNPRLKLRNALRHFGCSPLRGLFWFSG